MKEIWMCGFQGTKVTRENSGDNGERVPPVPIPNTEVKPFSADGTWLETARESRSLPDPKKKHPTDVGCFLFVPGHLPTFPGFQASTQVLG